MSSQRRKRSGRRVVVLNYYEFLWLDETIEHLAEHDVSPEEFEEVVSQRPGG